MKKKSVTIFMHTLSFLLLSSCIFSLFKTHPPCVTQPLKNVVSIELLDSSNDKINGEVSVLYTLSDDEFKGFWTEFMSIEFSKMINDPPTDFGNLAVRITYADCSVDIIGTNINRCENPDGKSIHKGWYSLIDNNDYLNLFSNYVENNLLPQTRQ